MPPRPNKKISGLQAAGIISFAVCMDLIQGIGEWSFTFLISVLGTAITFGFGAVPSIALGVAMGGIFSLLISTIAGIGLSWMFYRLDTPFAVKVGSAAIFETVPYLNMLPAWTFAAATTIMSANGKSLGGIMGSALTVLGGATSIAGKVASVTRPASTRTAQPAQTETSFEKGEPRIQRAANAPLQIDGIRGANDNTPRYSKAA